MTGRERFLRAIDHREVDRTPCFVAAEEEVWPRLMEHVGATTQLEVIRHFGGDSVQVSFYRPIPELKGVETVDDVERVRWPGPTAEQLREYAARVQAARETGLAVLGGAWASIFTHPRRAMGEAQYLTLMLDRPAVIARLVERDTESFLAINEAIFSRCACYLDVFFFGSDFGTQRSLFVAPELIQRFYLPAIKRLAEHARGYGLKVMYHTCGAISEIIPELIECGVDALDPVQVAAAGMEPARLVPQFGGRIAFHGGISTQRLLPSATPQEVYQTVRKTISAFGPTGYIAGPDQWLMADVPMENVEAMYRGIHAQ
ncbi:MAG: uroporphyrinogen decarboxylase family protein [Armatimonadota bacterium]